MQRVLSVLFLLLTAITSARGQESFGIAYYDVDGLYDSTPSQFYNDSDYTPKGRFHWDENRYNTKVQNIAQVVDSLALSVVILYGIENESVVRDIVSASKEDYAYIHRQSDSRDGLDFAVLYFGDRLFIDRIIEWRGALCVDGSIGHTPLTIIANHRSQSLGVMMEEYDLLREDKNIVILGYPNRMNFDRYDMHDATLAAEHQGRGNQLSQGRWLMRDRIATNFRWQGHCNVYIKSWLLDEKGAPKATFDKTKYRGGYSKYLPVFIYFREILEN